MILRSGKKPEQLFAKMRFSINFFRQKADHYNLLFFCYREEKKTRATSLRCVCVYGISGLMRDVAFGKNLFISFQKKRVFSLEKKILKAIIFGLISSFLVSVLTKVLRIVSWATLFC